MAALHLYFKRRLPGIPREHVTFFKSTYGLSFIDVSQNWEGLDPDKTVLSVISSNFEPLTVLPHEEERADTLIEELGRYLPEIRDAVENGDLDLDRTRASMQSHEDAPLFINTIGAWESRPTGDTEIENLFLAGDYCRTEADLTTMESAVSSGLITAGKILKQLQIAEDFGPIKLRTRSLPFHKFLKYAPYPGIRLLSMLVSRSEERRHYTNRG